VFQEHWGIKVSIFRDVAPWCSEGTRRLQASFSLRLHFNPEDGGYVFVTVDSYLPTDSTALHPSTQDSTLIFSIVPLRRVALVRTDVSEERIASIIRVIRNGELGTLAVTSNHTRCEETVYKNSIFRSVLRLLVTANVVPRSPILVTLKMEAIRSSETSILTTATEHNIPDDGILHCHRCENFKSYIALTGCGL
jgi:hypothetical protein